MAVDLVESAADWYAAMIQREREIIGAEKEKNEPRWPWPEAETLQEALDVERKGLRTVQGLWTAVIVLLVLAVIA